MNKPNLFLLLFLFKTLLISNFAFADGNIKHLQKDQLSPAATIEQLGWISGHWKGKAFGADVEEIWSTPQGNSMMASFRLIDKGEVQFYELEIIREVNQSLILELKHFSNELKGWESKDEVIAFPLVELAENTAYFDGMTFKKIGKNVLHIYVDIEENGKSNEVLFVYQKVD